MIKCGQQESTNVNIMGHFSQLFANGINSPRLNTPKCLELVPMQQIFFCLGSVQVREEEISGKGSRRVCPGNFFRPVRLACQPPVSSTFLSEQISHQQPASSTFLSEQTSTSHQPPAVNDVATSSEDSEL
jgi:hypothetical protein